MRKRRIKEEKNEKNTKKENKAIKRATKIRIKIKKK